MYSDDCEGGAYIVRQSTMHPMKRGTFPLGERNSFDGRAVKTNIALLLERVTEDAS